MRRRRFSRGAREPLMWDRNFSAMSSTDSAVLIGQVIYDPSLFSAGATDQRFTVRRIHLNIESVCFVNVHGGTAVFMRANYGIYLAGRDQPLRDPQFFSVTDQQTDWLKLWSDVAPISTSPPATLLSQNTAQRGPGGFEIDVKVSRRVNEDQVIVLALSTNTMGGTPPTDYSWNSFWVVSNLFSRTVRR